MLSFYGRHFSKAVILMAVRWYVAYALGYRDIEELMNERGVTVDHATVQHAQTSPSSEPKALRQAAEELITRIWRAYVRATEEATA